jgi:hypothetical protein
MRDKSTLFSFEGNDLRGIILVIKTKSFLADLGHKW